MALRPAKITNSDPSKCGWGVETHTFSAIPRKLLMDTTGVTPPQRTVLSEKSQPRHAWCMFPPISNSGNGRILEMKNRLVVAKDQRRSGESVCNSKTAKEGIHCAL